MRISFCTPCKGRLHHLKETLPKNLKDNERYPDVEFVVLDYNSPDGMEAWVRTHMMSEIKSGRVRYVRESTFPYFRMSHSKNLAQVASTGDIQCALDADNFIGPEWVGRLLELFPQPHPMFVRCDAEFNGDYGRVAHRRHDFVRLRGYDEGLKGWSYSDDDLFARSRGLRLKEYVIKTKGSGVIEHSDYERTQYLEMKSTGESMAFNVAWVASRNKSPVNPSGFGQAIVRVNFEDRPISVGFGPVGRPR